MPGNKSNTKTKNKQNKNSKTNNKNTGQTNGDCQEPDRSLLRKPIITSVNSFGQARKIFDQATQELKDLLSHECDLLYECKVCRNIFRSLANYISHKRVYCKEKYDISIHNKWKNASLIDIIQDIKDLEQGYQDSLNENTGNVDDEHDGRIPLTKDLTKIVEKLTKIKGVSQKSYEDSHVVLQAIPSTSAAVFQSLVLGEEKLTDSMRTEVNELDQMAKQDTALIMRDGKFKMLNSLPDADNVIQISDDEDDTDDVFQCKICKMQYTTQKTLEVHMKHKHDESRLVFPCPDCCEVFSTSWSVYRHIFKVHSKSLAQVRKLRESIQTKAFRLNNPSAAYKKRMNKMKTIVPPKMTEEDRREQENQAWMDSMEGDCEVPRCGGCERTFERRAALAAHTHTCQSRTRAIALHRRLAAASHHDTKRIEIQIRKDYNKGTTQELCLVSVPAVSKEKNGIKEEPAEVSQPITEEKPIEEVKSIDREAPMDVSADDNTPTDTEELSEKEDTNLGEYTLAFKEPLANQVEKNNLVAFRQKIKHSIDYTTLTCKKCDTQYNEAHQLYNHMAGHIKWVRYACKLCHFKHYNLENLLKHLELVHKLKGDNDFYFNIVKPVDGTDALDLCEEEFDANENSPDSGQPSQCPADSTRLSDDSTASGIRVEGVATKRKLCQTERIIKRKKEFTPTDGEDSDVGEAVTSNITKASTSNLRSYEETSSDIDDIEESIPKRQAVGDDTTVASKRPVRKKTKPQNDDFEYDLSNVPEMEEQGYGDSQSMTNAKSSETNKKPQPEDEQNDDNIDCSGALLTMSNVSAMQSAAQLKNIVAPQDVRALNAFLRRKTKNIRGSPKKKLNDDQNETCCLIKEESPKELTPRKADAKADESTKNLPTKAIDKSQKGVDTVDSSFTNTSVKDLNKEQDYTNTDAGAGQIPATLTALPIIFPSQSLEVINNPIINKNIKDFTKAGKTTKILVIKPINSNKDGMQPVNTSRKFQTIKLRDPNKGLLKEEKDQVVVVKIPKVEGIARQAGEVSGTIGERLLQADPNKTTDTLPAANNDTNSSTATGAELIKTVLTKDEPILIE